MDIRRLQHGFLWTLFAFITGLLAYLFLPYAVPVIMGLILAVVAHPLYVGINRHLIQNTTGAAFVSTVLVFCLLIVPLVLFGVFFLEELRILYVQLSDGQGFSPLAIKTFDWFQRFFPGTSVSPSDILGTFANITQNFVNSAGALLGVVVNSVIELFLALIVLFYVLKDGAKLRARLFEISPLPHEYNELLFERVRTAVAAVVRGTLMVAGIQGVAASIGFVIFGAPAPIIWGFLSMIAAFVPLIGTGSIWAPMAIYLVVSGHLLAGIGLALWGTLITSTVDNLVTPKLIETKLSIHPVLILFSMLGGLDVFGFIGLLLGPVILSLWFALLSVYEKEIGQVSSV